MKSKHQQSLDLGHKMLFALVLSLAISSIVFFQSDTQTGAAAGTGTGALGISRNIASIFLNSTDPTLNDTNQNLTSHIESNTNLNIINWYLNDSSITVLNIPFEKVDGTDTNNVQDYSPNNYSFSVVGPTWNETGGFDGNGSYSFDGTNDYLRLASIPNRPGSQMTVCSWIKTANFGSKSTIFTISRNPSSIINEGLFLINETGTLLFWDYDGVDYGFQESSGTSTTNVADGNWHHVCFVKDETSGTYYVDGAQDGTKVASRDVQYNSNDFVIGGDYRDSDFYFDGQIDEFQLFNRSLTSDQIFSIYANQSLIVSQETSANDTWSFCATPNDNSEDGQTKCSNSLTVAGDTTPSISSALINSTTPTINSTNDNITSHVTADNPLGSASDLKYIYSYYVNGSNYTLLNMPFEKVNKSTSDNAHDYSNSNITGIEQGSIVWNTSGGFDGKGSYEFDGIDDYINLSRIPIPTKTVSVSMWIKQDVTGDNDHDLLVGRWGHGAGGFALFRDFGSNQLHWAISAGAGNQRKYDTTNNVITSTNTWYHVAATFVAGSSTEAHVYVNGVDQALTVVENSGSVNSIIAPDVDGAIGYDVYDSSGFFEGTIDEVMIFNANLSQEQVQAIYNNRTDLIVSQETSGADNWSYCVTANSANEDSNTVCSSSLEVNALPTIPALVAPTNASSRTNRSVQFEWGTSTDANTDDSITYSLQLFNSSSEFNDLSNTFINQSSIQENSSTDVNYTYLPDLAVDDTFYFRLRASDGKEESAWSELFQFNTLSSNVISLPTSSVSFGEINSSFDKNTTAGSSYQPLIISNDGNIPLNISLNSSQMFTSANSLWQFQVEENETGAYISANESWTNFTINLNATMHIFNLWHENDSNTANRANLHSLVYAAADESAGSKTATIYIESTSSE